MSDQQDDRTKQPQRSQRQTGRQSQFSRGRERSFYDRIVGDVSVEKAVLFGVVAAIAVFLICAGVAAIDPGMGDQDAREPEVAEPSWLDSRTALFFSTHFVDLRVTATAAAGERVESIDVLEQEEDTYPALIYRLIPVTVLVIVGHRFASRKLDRQTSVQRGSRVGALIAAGYLPAVVIGFFVFSHQYQYQGSMITWEAPLVPAVFIAGVAYPLICGALGGYLYWRGQGVAIRQQPRTDLQNRGTEPGGRPQQPREPHESADSQRRGRQDEGKSEPHEMHPDRGVVCPECGSEVPAYADYCKACGTALD